MALKVGDTVIEISKEVEQLPKAFVDFAIKHRSTNGAYFWCQRNMYGIPWRLENIHLIDREWGWMPKTRALSLRFSFSRPEREHVYSKTMTECEKDAYCYKRGLIEHDFYYVNLGVGNDIYAMLVELNLAGEFLVEFADLIEHWI